MFSEKVIAGIKVSSQEDVRMWNISFAGPHSRPSNFCARSCYPLGKKHAIAKTGNTHYALRSASTFFTGRNSMKSNLLLANSSSINKVMLLLASQVSRCDYATHSRYGVSSLSLPLSLSFSLSFQSSNFSLLSVTSVHKV